MLEILSRLLQPQTLFVILIAMAAFATVLTITAPYMRNDELKARMKLVGAERDRLRASQRVRLSSEGRLRDRRPRSLARRIVDGLNLRRVFEAESSRDLLRQAGLRSENHLLTYLAVRLASPILLAAAAFIYSSILFAEKLSPVMRMAVTMGAAVGGYYLSS